MRDVDQALARAFARRGAPPGSSSLPPPPHFKLDPPAPAVAADVDPSESGSSWRWPETVRALERDHAARFERFADSLVAARQSQSLRVLLFTSCHRAEGRTTLVLTLARALARRPGKTLLVDADLTGPMLARSLGIRPEVGLEDVVEGGTAVTDALIESRADALTILPLRTAVGHPKDFLASAAWSCLMARLRREFDQVLLDGSPLFAGLSAAVLHRSVDAAVLVHHRGLTGERALLRAREVLEAGGVPLLGLAETFV